MTKATPPRPIRIAYFVTALETGGTERSLVQLLAGLPSAEYEKHVICLSGFGPLEEDARAAGAVLHDVRYPRLRVGGQVQWKRLPEALLAVPRLVAILRRIRPDILHTMIPVCNVLGAIAGKVARVRCIVCSKLSLGVYRDKNRLLAWLEDRVAPAYTLVHCKSQGIVDDVVAREPIDGWKMRVVYNGLDTSRYGPAAGDPAAVRESLGIPKSAPVIGMVANLWAYKGHADMLDAAASLVRDYPNLRLLFVGRDEGMGPELQEKARRLGIERTMILTGERRDIPALMRAMDILVSASHEEGFSNVLLEGMASGLPVVATRVGGNPEAVVHEETGFIVPPREPRELARALRPLLENPDLARQMGAAGRRRAAERFSREAMVEGMKLFYAEALDQP